MIEKTPTSRGIRFGFTLPLLLITSLLAGCANMNQSPPGNANGLPNNPTENQQAAQINTELAVGYFREGHLDVAVEKAKRAIYYDDNFAAAHHAYALILDRLGETQKAGDEFARAYALDPHNSDLDNNYATYLCGQKEYSKAQDLFRRAYSDPLYRTPEFALANSGVCYESAHDDANAIKQFNTALDRMPAYGPAILGLARVHYAEGNFAAAAKDMQRYETSNRHTPETLKLAIRIDRATGNQASLANHVLILKGRFPDSPVAKWFDSGAK